MKKIIIFLLILSISVFSNELLLQVDKNLQPGSNESYKKLINIEPDGSKKEFLIYAAKSGTNKMVALFLKPEADKGRATLRLDDNMWMYLPNIGKPIRITSMQSVVGGVFNNSDIMRLDFSTEYSVIKQEENSDTYILDLKAKTDTVAYDRLVMIVDKKTITPIKIECYSSTKMLIKTIMYKDIKDFGGGVVRPAVMETVSPFYKGYKSIMIYGKITPKNFPNEAFTIENIDKVNDLRQ